jgi:hypothetical protein
VLEVFGGDKEKAQYLSEMLAVQWNLENLGQAWFAGGFDFFWCMYEKYRRAFITGKEPEGSCPL